MDIYQHMKKYFCLLLALFVFFQCSLAQYKLEEVTPLGKLQARHVKYYADTKEWVLSNGFYVFKMNESFEDAKLLFNTYPKYQFELERLPNKNFFCRHFDTESPPYGLEYRANKLDSSAIYIMEDSLKNISPLNPFTYVRGRIVQDNKKLRLWAMNNCFLWGKDSALFCTDALIGILRIINNKDSIYNIRINSSIKAFETSADGAFIAAGTKDSGWYFITSAKPEKFIKMPASADKNEATGFYFDDSRKQLWVKEEKSWLGLQALVQYDYSSGLPKLVKRITADELGLNNETGVNLEFDYRSNKVYIHSGIRQLILVDLKTQKVAANLSWPITELSVINQIYFNASNNFLYISGSKYDSTFTNSKNFLYRIEKDTAAQVNIIRPKNKTEEYNADAAGMQTSGNKIPQALKKDTLAFVNTISAKNKSTVNNLYPAGMQTAVNKLPVNAYAVNNNNVSLAANDLAIIPYAGNEYMLYNVRSGNMIRSFRAANTDLDINSRFSKENTVQLSPDGKTIFEWAIKPGIAPGIADSLQMSLTNINTGLIIKNKLILSQKERTQIRNFTWDDKGRPVFAQTASATHPSIKVSSFYIDSLLQPQPLVEYIMQSPGVIYNAWNIAGTKNMLVETGETGANKMYNYLLLNAATEDSPTLLVSSESINVMQNSAGFLLHLSLDGKDLLNWYNLQGKLLHSSSLTSAAYRRQQLANHSAHYYLTDLNADKACRLNLLTGNVTALQGKSKAGFNYKVSPDEKLLVSVSDNMQAWQIQNDSLYKLYHLQASKDFIKYTQLTNKHLISDGRIWNLQNGLMMQADLADLAAVNDTQYLQTVYKNEILDDLGYDENYKRQYQLKAHKKIFSKSILGQPNLSKWSDGFNGILIASKYFAGNVIENIYELPLAKESLSEIKIYPISFQQAAFIIKSKTEIFASDPMKSIADTLLLLDLETGKSDAKLVGKITGLRQMEANGAYFFYLLNQQTGAMQLYATEKNQFKKIDNKIKLTIDSFRQVNIVDEHTIVYTSTEGVVLYNLQTGEKELIRFTYLSGNFTMTSFLHYEPAEKALYIVYDDGGILKIVNKKVVESVKAMPSAESIAGVHGKHLLALDRLGNYYFINKNTLHTELTLFTWKGKSFADRKYMWLTKENYYMATPGVESNIHFINNSSIIPLKQGDLLYNQPGKVLEYLDAPKAEIDFYNQLHQIRLNKYKTSKSSASLSQSAIQLNVSTLLSQKNATLTVNANAAEKITALQVMVNGCPVDVPLQKTNSRQLQQTFSLALNAGQNIIYTWVEDENGNRSRFDEQKILGEFTDSGKWYFVGIGVSQYRDTLQNLKYADKDIRDISKFLSSQYPGIIIDTLLNEQVTAANIKKIATKLNGTHADDKVMVSFSGHGLLDKENKFWYATHDVNFAEPEQVGFSMASISAMLQNIPARYRMITLDACHSGDVVQASMAAVSKTEILQEPAKAAPGIKGNILLSVKRADKSSSQLLKSMQMVFTDQLSNTGINLIAASSGTEFALEGKEWNNGVFTYALINGWSFGARENFSNHSMHYRSLKQYLQQRVSSITNGRQTPNTVMENGEINWWLIPEN